MSAVFAPAFVLRGDSLTLVVASKSYTVSRSDQRYQKLLELAKLIRSGSPPTEQDWLDALNPVKQVAALSNALSQVSDSIVVSDTGEVFINGESVHNTITKRIKELFDLGLPFQPLVNFLTKLRENPSYKAQQQLLNFLENRSLPITEDGDFLGYKAVRNDYKDIYSGKFDNTPGQTPSMNRSDVDDDNQNQCSKGLHVGGLDYVKGYGNVEKDRIIIVKVNPKNAVSVPTDYNHQKLRVCEYYVVGDYQGEMNDCPVYTSDAKPYALNDEQPEDFSYNHSCDNCDGGWDNEDDEWDDEYSDYDNNEEDDEYLYDDDN